MDNERKPPIHVVKVGAIKASVWENIFKMQGKEIVNNSVVVTKVYKDRDGNWKDTNSLKANDIPKAIIALEKAYLWLVNGPDAEEQEPPAPNKPAQAPIQPQRTTTQDAVSAFL